VLLAVGMESGPAAALGVVEPASMQGGHLSTPEEHIGQAD
jgi:hypothetical protein